MFSKICILGAGGFLGSSVCSLLSTSSAWRGASIVFVDFQPPRDLALRHKDFFVSAGSDDKTVEEALDGVEACVNLSAKVFSESESAEEQIVELLEASVAPLHRYLPLLGATLRYFLQLSTISVYEDTGLGVPFEEDSTLAPTSPYGVGKLAAEILLRIAASSRGFGLQILRLPDVYGRWPRDRRDRRLYPELMRAIAAGSDWRGRSDGNERVDLLHVTDAARAVCLALTDPRAGSWNVGSGSGYRAIDLLSALLAVIDRPSAVRFQGDRARSDRLLATTKFWSTYGFSPRMPLEAGIRDEFSYHLRNGTLAS